MKYILIVLLAMASVVFNSAEAIGVRLDTKVERKEQTCVPIGKSAAMSAAAQQTDGRVLSATLNMNRRPPIYRVKVLSSSGRVSHVFVNACNGRVIR